MTKRTLYYLLFTICCSLTATAQSPYRLMPIHKNLTPMVRASTPEEVRAWLGVNQVSTIPTNAVVVDTISGLPSITVSGGNPAVAITRGFYAAGDAGAATYVWTPTIPFWGQTNIFMLAANGGGYWVEYEFLTTKRMNVVKAGAKPAGEFDNAPVLQSVLNTAATQATGGGISSMGDEPVIYIPAGYYRFYGPVYYLVPSLGHADIRIVGDGPRNTILAHHFTQGPLLNIQNVKLSMSGLQIYAAATPVEYGRDGLYLLNVGPGNIHDVMFVNCSRAIILNGNYLNNIIFNGVQFENCNIDFLPIEARGTTILGANTSGGKYVWFGNAYGTRWFGVAGGKAGNSFAPAVFVVPAGRDSNFDLSYSYGNNWVAILGHNVTNRATATVDGGNIRLTFEEQHLFSSGDSAVIVAEQTVPQDIQDYLVGTRTLNTASVTNNYAILTPGGTITNDLSGYTFLVIKNLGNYAGVVNTRIRSSYSGNFYDQDPDADYFAALGNAHDIVLEGAGTKAYTITPNTGRILLSGEEIIPTAFTYPVEQSDRTKMLVPENIFPDPTFETGLSWVNGASLLSNNGNLVATNYHGQPALLYYQSARAASGYPQVHHDFQPIRTMSSLTGKRLAVAAEVIELNHPIFVPTDWTINSSGFGYSDGPATINHLGRTIQVTLTTSTGGITGLTWNYGAFATNVIDSPVTVVQSGSSGGTVTPTAFDNRSYSNQRYVGRSLYVTVRRAGDDLNQPTLASSLANLMIVDPITGHYKTTVTGKLGPHLGSMSGLRISIYSSELTPGVATGCEAFLIKRLYVFTDPMYYHNLDSTVFADRVNQWANTLSEYSNASRFGSGWPGTAEVNISRLFAGQEGGVTTMRFQRDNDTIATIPGFRGVTTTTPANPIPGDGFLSNNVYYIYSGTQWIPLN